MIINKAVKAIKTIIISSVTNVGINELLEVLEYGKTYAFLGSSGVGKSTIINKLIITIFRRFLNYRISSILSILTIILICIFTYLLTFFTSPMRLFGSIALFSSLSGLVIGGILAGTKIYYGIIGGWSGFHAYQIGNRPLLLLSILLVVIGIQLLMMGFLGEMIMRIYYESRDKPIYHIRQFLN